MEAVLIIPQHEWQQLQTEIGQLKRQFGELLTRTAQPEEAWLDAAQAAELMGIEPNTLGKIRRAGRLPAGSYRERNRKEYEYLESKLKPIRRKR